MQPNHIPGNSEEFTEAAELRLSIHDSIHLIHREDWESLAKDASLYLCYDHLSALEDVLSDQMEFRYVIYYCQKYQPVGIAYFQVVDLVDNGSKYREAVSKLGYGIGASIINEMKVHSLVCGNVFHCGDHGAYFQMDMTLEQKLTLVQTTMQRLKKGGRFKFKVSILLFKEFWPEQFVFAQTLEKRRYHPLAMDVNMVMEVDPDWKDLEAYRSVLTSKARTRIKSIIARSSGLEIKDMSAASIKMHAPRMQIMFDQVLERSPFNFGHWNVKVYERLKEIHGEKLMFHGFFLNGELVGFNAAFVLGDTLDAQFVGIDYARDQEHLIYQRMLVDLLEFAIERGVSRINFGRTAEQAKSNIGALPIEMKFYVKHRNTIANGLIGPLLRSVKPTEFEQRSPFKTVEVE